jgi:hypothetical protein
METEIEILVGRGRRDRRVGPTCHINSRGCGIGAIARVEVKKHSPESRGSPYSKK